MVAYLQRRHYVPIRAAAARLPSARPARPGHGAVPLPRRRSRSITRELLDAACRAYFVDDEPSRIPCRRAAGCGAARDGRGRTDMSTDVRAARTSLRSAGARCSSACCSCCCRSTCSATSSGPQHVTGLLLLVSEALVVVLTVVRRRAQIVDRLGGRGHRDDGLARRVHRCCVPAPTSAAAAAGRGDRRRCRPPACAS